MPVLAMPSPPSIGEQPVRWFTRPLAQAALLSLLCALQFLPWLANRGLWYPDEPDVGEPTRAMYLAQDWVLPTHNGAWWIDYPPLIYWLGMAVAKAAGGLSEWTLRLPSALAATALVLATWHFTATRLGPAAGLCAGLILALLPQFQWQAVNVHPDMVFACFQGLGIFAYLAGEQAPAGRRWLWRILGFACLGAAFLAKGPLGLLLPGLVLSLWLLSQGRWRGWLALAPLALVSLALVLPWYLALGGRIGHASVWHEFWAQNFARFEGAERGHRQPWYYYLTHVWGDWSLWALPFVTILACRWRAVWRDPWLRLALLWALSVLVFFTLAETKRQVYLLPMYPALAMLAGAVLTVALDPDHPDRRLFGRMLAAMASLAGLTALLATVACTTALLLGGARVCALLGLDNNAIASLVPTLRPAALALTLLCLVVAIAVAIGLRRRHPGLQFAGLAGLHLGAWVVAVALILPVLDPVKSYRPPAERIAGMLVPGAELGFHYPGREQSKTTGFCFYTGARLALLPTPEALAAFLDRDKQALAVVGAPMARTLAADPRFTGRERERFRVGLTEWVLMGGLVQPPAGAAQGERSR